MRQRVRRVTCLALLLAASPSFADTVYRWVDERGTVHFSDAPPPQGAFESQTMPDAPPTAVPTAQSAAPASGDTTASPAAAEAPPSGPARVAVTDQGADAVAPTVQVIRGRVKNEGGRTASDVHIAVVVTEPVQGAECLQDTIDVEPATLEPGEEGTFEAEYTNPCFHGPTDVLLKPQWR